jgi:hypothetical protein
MFELTALGKVKGVVGSTLLIPLFSARTSNHTFVHELGPLYTIQRFRRCNIEYFDIIPRRAGDSCVEGGAGFIAFEAGNGKIFVGTRAELMQRWQDFAQTIRVGDLLHAVVVEIISDNPVAKFDAWRAYVKKNYGSKGSMSEIADGKLAHLQRIKQFWEEIESEPFQEEDDEDVEFSELIKLDEDNLKAYLRDTGEFPRRVWRRVWEYADRVLLDSKESREIVMEYIKYCNDEFPDVPQGSWSRMIRRAMMFDRATDGDVVTLRDFFGTCLPTLKRSRIEPEIFKDCMKRLYRNESGILVADLVSMIGRVTECVLSTEDGEKEIDFVIICAIVNLLKQYGKEGHFTKEDIMVLVEFFYGVLINNEAGLGRCVRDFNDIARPYGIDSSVIRAHLTNDRANRVLDNIFERIRMPTDGPDGRRI